MKFYVVKNMSKKSGKEYTALALDLGYRQVLISFDLVVISEVSGLSFSEIYALENGSKVLVGDYVSKNVKAGK